MAGHYQSHYPCPLCVGREQLGGSPTVLRPSGGWWYLPAWSESFFPSHVQQSAICSLPEQTVLIWWRRSQRGVFLAGNLDTRHGHGDLDYGWPAVLAGASVPDYCLQPEQRPYRDARQELEPARFRPAYQQLEYPDKQLPHR